MTNRLLDRLPRVGLLAILAALALSAFMLADSPGAAQGNEVTPSHWPGPAREVLTFDVAENATRFVFDEAPLFDDGMPAYGNSFVTEGYIYPDGTLSGGNGVLANGEPEFPDKVLGTWICRGFFIGDGAHTLTGPWVITTQNYNFGTELGDTTLVSEGYEVADVDVAIERAITGGTGPYRFARGEASQVLLGFNETTGVNLRFEMNVSKR